MGTGPRLSAVLEHKINVNSKQKYDFSLDYRYFSTQVAILINKKRIIINKRTNKWKNRRTIKRIEIDESEKI